MTVSIDELACADCDYWYKDGECPECHGKAHCFWDGRDCPPCMCDWGKIADLRSAPCI